MNRCLSFRALHRQVLTALLAAALPALAQDAVRPFPDAALRGELVVTAAPEVRLDGQPARLAPGARIRGPNNLLLTPASVAGQALTVNYLRDAGGQIREVWVLTAAEAREQRAGAGSGRNFLFQSEQQGQARDDGQTPYHQLPGYPR